MKIKINGVVEFNFGFKIVSLNSLASHIWSEIGIVPITNHMMKD